MIALARKLLKGLAYPESIKPAIARKFASASSALVEDRISSVSQQLQCMLKQQYFALRGSAPASLPSFRDVSFRCYSQFEEDGILLFIFSLVGERTRRVVEIGAGNGRECMAANLIINHGWQGYLFDGDAENLAKGSNFFAHHADTSVMPPIFRHAWITAENVNDVLRQAGAEGEIDLLSLDIDGNDYWVWKAISIIHPRVCVFETHDIIPGDMALTIPYDPQFSAWDKPYPDSEFRSVSLKAMVNVSREKGYRLVGSHRRGFNVFFMRDGVGRDHFPEVSIASVHDNPWTRYGQLHRWPKVAQYPWVRV